MLILSHLPSQQVLPSPDIVVTAARGEQSEDETAASVTVLDADSVERRGEPLAVHLLRQVPSVAIAQSGPAGSVTEVRIRGAEARHTLLFIDGIRANDPAAGNVPRFELLNADIASRIEVVRGPQSALWGAEALGGVVSVEGSGAAERNASLEGGSFGFARASAAIGERLGKVAVNLAGGFQRAGGIDAFAGPRSGDRDGYRNLSLRGRASWSATPALTVGASGFAIRARSQFDGLDPVSFTRRDTLDNSVNRLAAGRLWTEYREGPWLATLWGSRLGSSQRNRLDDTPVDRTSARRTAAGAQVERNLETGDVRHRLILAADWEGERFRSRSLAFPDSNKDRDRTRTGLVGEWQMHVGDLLVTDLAIRRDRFNRFRDATTVRASALLNAAKGLQLAASYGEGIAQPSFIDLFGFYPGIFTGNPGLRPERSRGVELSVRYGRGALRGALTAYREVLRDEILGLFTTTINAEGRSRRRGFEAEVGWSAAPWLRLNANYSYLKASQQTDPLASPIREARRPKHSGSVVADGSVGRWVYGASVARVGQRRDTDFDVFPAQDVRLSGYWLAGGRLAYRVSETVEVFGRVENGFDADYQDVFGYRTEGRSAYAGIRLALGR